MTFETVSLLVAFVQVMLSAIPIQSQVIRDLREFQRGRIKNGDPVMTCVTRNVYQCNQLCHVTKSCLAISYDVTSRSCTTFSSSVADSVLDKREDHVINKDLVHSSSSACVRGSCKNGTVCVVTGNSYMCVNQSDKGFLSYKSICESHDGYSWSRSNGICYKFNLNIAVRQQAKLICEQDGGRLIKIDSLKKQETVVGIVLSDPVLDEVGRFWIGADRSQVDGKWRWTDGSLVEELFWGPGQPNGGDNGEFVVIGRNVNYMWNDRRWKIKSDTVGALCEIPVW